MTDWNPCTTVNGYNINNKKLWDNERMILVTYQTVTGRRYVKSVLSQRGRIAKKVGGEIVAWAEMPEPYGGDQ